MEKTITKDVLKNKLYSGAGPAIEFLYSRYSAMLFSYVLQFIPLKEEAEDLLADIFSRLTYRLQEACNSSLSVYCWLQVEARKIILEYNKQKGNEHASLSGPLNFIYGPDEAYYFALLQEASPEHQWVFRELFLNGRQREELAQQLRKDKAYIDTILLESLVIIRNKLAAVPDHQQ